MGSTVSTGFLFYIKRQGRHNTGQLHSNVSKNLRNNTHQAELPFFFSTPLYHLFFSFGVVQALAQVITFKEGELYPKLLLFLSLHILLVTVSVDSVFWIVLDMTNPLHSRSAGYWHFSLGPMQSPHGPFLCLCSCTFNPISASQFLSKWKLEDVMCFLKMLKLLR